MTMKLKKIYTILFVSFALTGVIFSTSTNRREWTKRKHTPILTMLPAW